MAGGIAADRLKAERKSWRKDHPVGFVARPKAKSDGSTNLFCWECRVPGKKKGDWEGGIYKVELAFTESYPSEAPRAKFTPPVFHPNVYTDGRVCLSIIGKDWKPSITLKQILLGLQDLLEAPNFSDPANSAATSLYRRSNQQYKQKVLAEVAKHRALDA
eukprot:CAMPEP_0194039406 /NCGR_PEP_ID=MMETSP0009_2-20130614/11538_1 /TAXON_ID=210454 /ORGANISM="Grammatophora oceanica, Strain CCMP 410" /LENGTH=159 /DNA_ID=CAMNT_0038682231 /DNA_START=69 /DNA_END=548 /DNA_ORIENTATION=-